MPPTTHDRQAFIHGAGKYSQIGVEAAQGILTSMMAGAKLTEFKAIIITDLYVNVADFLFGFILRRSNFDVSAFYFGVCEDQVELDWVMTTMRDMLSARMLEGQMPLPNGHRLPVLTEDMLDAMPEKTTNASLGHFGRRQVAHAC